MRRREPIYKPDDNARSGVNICANCLVGPTKKQLDASKKKLPNAYESANLTEEPTKTSGKKLNARNSITQPIVALMTNAIIRCFQERLVSADNSLLNCVISPEVGPLEVGSASKPRFEASPPPAPPVEPDSTSKEEFVDGAAVVAGGSFPCTFAAMVWNQCEVAFAAFVAAAWAFAAAVFKEELEFEVPAGKGREEDEEEDEDDAGIHDGSAFVIAVNDDATVEVADEPLLAGFEFKTNSRREREELADIEDEGM